MLTASPVQLVVMLYDGVERFLRQAEVAMREGEVAQAHEPYCSGPRRSSTSSCARSTTSSGEIAERLEAIYVFCKRAT